MSKYTFPFNTCEKPNKNGIAQPYSAFFNLITCSIIFYFLIHTKTLHAFILLFCILIFELFHVFSHIIHIEGPSQINITHLLTYLMNIAFFYLFYSYTKKFPSYQFIIYMSLLVILDVYTFYNHSFVYYLTTQSAIFISLLLYYFSILPKFIQSSVYKIIFFVSIVIGLFINETYNCINMMSLYPHFPYHIFIETIGIMLFYVICSNFYKL
uniref:Uncharacterized protein n=1 Tax=viral metagenome TaxID=1070528 RepID=A0A6C0B862_9ZZZZ